MEPVLIETHEREYIQNRGKRNVIRDQILYVIGGFDDDEFRVSSIRSKTDFVISPTYVETQGTKPCYVWKV